jgi:hypothetical protein
LLRFSLPEYQYFGVLIGQFVFVSTNCTPRDAKCKPHPGCSLSKPYILGTLATRLAFLGVPSIVKTISSYLHYGRDDLAAG